jgi:hypothetical protein
VAKLGLNFGNNLKNRLIAYHRGKSMKTRVEVKKTVMSENSSFQSTSLKCAITVFCFPFFPVSAPENSYSGEKSALDFAYFWLTSFLNDTISASHETIEEETTKKQLKTPKNKTPKTKPADNRKVVISDSPSGLVKNYAVN